MAHTDQPTSTGEVCLIADDDEFFRVALRSILQNKLSCSHVIETGSLDEAVEKLSEAGPVTLAIFDLAMPGMESAASLRAIRECFPTTQVAVVSASKRRLDILQALEAGVHGYVPKGLGVAELARALQTIRDGTIYVPAHIAEVAGQEDETGLRLDGRRDFFATQLFARGDTPQGSSSGQSIPTLTARQRDVLELLVQGLANKEIARALSLGEGTIKVHIAALFRSLGVTSRAAAAASGARWIKHPQTGQSR